MNYDTGRRPDITGPPSDPKREYEMSFPLDFDGQSFLSRHSLAKHLAPLTGRSIHSCIQLLKRHHDDPTAAITQLRRPPPLYNYNGRSFRNLTHLARYLSPIIGRSVDACRVMLRAKGNDPAAVVALYRAIDSRSYARVGSRTYRTKQDFIRYVHRYFGTPAGIVTNWLKNTGDSITEEFVADLLRRAKEHRTTKPAWTYWSGPVVLFGWRFRSFTALCRYYGRSPSSWNAKWREHAANGGTPARFSPLLEAIARLRQWNMLDARIRRYDESEIPRRCLPLNATQEEISEFEQRLIHALQPLEVDPLRRAALEELERRSGQSDSPDP